MRQHDPGETRSCEGCALSWHYKPFANGSFNNQNYRKLCKNLAILYGGVIAASQPGFFACCRNGTDPPAGEEAKFSRS